MTTELPILKEILQRVRRTETRVYKIAEKVDAEAPPGSPVQVFVKDRTTPYAILQGYDVTLSAIRKETIKAGIGPGGGFDIFIGDKCVGFIELE